MQPAQLASQKSRFSLRPLVSLKSTFAKVFKKKNKPQDQDISLDQKLPKTKPKLKRWHKILIIIGLTFLVLLTAGGALAYQSYQIALDLKTQAGEIKDAGLLARTSFNDKNLPEAERYMQQVQKELEEFRSTYTKLSFYKKLPFTNGYYEDGIHGLNAADAGVSAALKALTETAKYADLLGFTGETEAAQEAQTAEDRIGLLLQTLDKITPILDDITSDVEVVRSELALIDESRYPEKFRDQAVRSRITQAKQQLSQGTSLLTDYRPIIEKLPELAGANGERKKYLVLFQNNNELRPTGGFLTAYSIIYIENGKVTPESSDDIYELDQRFREKLPIPEPLGKYLTTEKYWNLRDMNISPDFKTSMDQFFTNYKIARNGDEDIDGIIAVDTRVLTQLLEQLGPVEVPGFGVFSAENDERCDCPQVVYALSEIITKPTPYLREDRKGIIGPMMRAILTKAYDAPSQKNDDLFTVGLTSLDRKHLQFYFVDKNLQAAVEAINAAGTMSPDESAQDFLAIVDANLGGAKSNLFTSYEVTQIVSAPENGQVEKTVEITYNNSRKGDNCNLEAGLLCLNATLPTWNRLYLPEGAELVEAEGYSEEATLYEENGFSVIDGFFNLEPNSQAKIKVTYSIPYNDTETYRVKLWKQGGVDPIKNVIEVGGGQEEILLDKDQVYQTSFE